LALGARAIPSFVLTFSSDHTGPLAMAGRPTKTQDRDRFMQFL